MKKILLDTNAYSSYLRGDKKVLDILSDAEKILLSVFVIGELYYGFRGGNNESRNKLILEQFIDKPNVKIIRASQETAEIFAVIKHNLKKSGNPIPLNDVWIAAHALETSSVLVTYDRHFQQVSNLRIWDFGTSASRKILDVGL